ncbi:MAG: hypothetical protein E6J90_15100 [Deltaproteobacteria bacterium]|nr:MAG: hypothetical protein E6J91_46135 [Deltaproteobacteria bacterium]TMQ20980.1 MAG: hypothetical protein E6J90_15100 [Deltaproteobacteria bacterium]
MPRLGELLVAAGLLTPEQVEQALRAQVLWGGRLGTNLVELHYLELDPLSAMLGRQQGMPAALARHFEKADPALQRLLSADIAERFSCLPLLRMGPERHVVIASLGPLSRRQLAVIAGEIGVEVPRLVPAIAAELRIRYQLERVYRIRRTARFLRARGKSVPPFPAFPVLSVLPESEPDAPSLPTSTREMAVYRPPDVRDAREARDASEPAAVPAPAADFDETEPTDDDLIPIEVVAPTTSTEDLDDLSRHAVIEDYLAIPGGPIVDEASGRERRHYVRTIADAPASDPEAQALLARIAIRKVAVGSAPRVMAGATLGEATRAIRRSTSRDRVADLVIDTLDRFAPACDAAILLVIRGATAIGWKGFQRAGAGLGEIAVPMDSGGLVPRAVELNVTLRGSTAQIEPLDELLLASLGRDDGDLVVVPISIADQVMCVIAIATAENAPIACAEPIAAAAGAAFARLMRDASR